jgi:hypothetical protein
MPTDLDKLLGVIPALRGNAMSAQTNRSLIEHGEHATIQKLPAAPVVPVVPVGPGNTKGKSSLEVMAESTGKTIEQYKAEKAAQRRAMLEAHQRKYAK